MQMSLRGSLKMSIIPTSKEMNFEMRDPNFARYQYEMTDPQSCPIKMTFSSGDDKTDSIVAFIISIISSKLYPHGRMLPAISYPGKPKTEILQFTILRDNYNSSYIKKSNDNRSPMILEEHVPIPRFDCQGILREKLF